MRLELSMKQAVVRRVTRDFAEKEITPFTAEMDRTGQYPWELSHKMAALNYFGLQIPPEYGGAGLDTVSYAIVIEEISRVSGAMGLAVTVHNSVAAQPLYDFGIHEQRQQFLVPLAKGEKIGSFCLTEPNAGSDASALETTALRKGDDYIVNGNKIFVTNGGSAEILLIFAYLPPAEPGKKRYAVLIVEADRQGVEKSPLEDLSGMRGNPVCSVTLSDCRIPRQNLLGGEGDGLKIALSSLNGGRIGIAAQAVGLAQAALDHSLKYARERVQFGKPIASFGAIQAFLADMAVKIEGARLLTHRAAFLKDQGRPYTKESAMAKVYASETAVSASRIGVQIHGGYGYSKSYPIERIYRDAKVTEIYEGTSEVQRMVIARSL
jgi:butyryl-CoA dehydrogenase